MRSLALSMVITIPDALEQLLEEPFIDGRLVEISDSVSTADQSAQRLGVNKERIVKSLVFLVDELPYLVIVPGTRRADPETIRELLEADSAEIAPYERVEELTGYEPGAVPPIGTGLTAIIEEDILEHETVYGGGGGQNLMLEINPRCIVGEDDVVAHIT